jgi:hypothetical protein
VTQTPYWWTRSNFNPKASIAIKDTLAMAMDDRRLIELATTLLVSGDLDDQETHQISGLGVHRVGVRVERSGMGDGTRSRVPGPAMYHCLPAITRENLKNLLASHGVKVQGGQEPAEG